MLVCSASVFRESVGVVGKEGSASWHHIPKPCSLPTHSLALLSSSSFQLRGVKALCDGVKYVICASVNTHMLFSALFSSAKCYRTNLVLLFRWPHQQGSDVTLFFHLLQSNLSICTCWETGTWVLSIIDKENSGKTSVLEVCHYTWHYKTSKQRKL